MKTKICAAVIVLFLNNILSAQVATSISVSDTRSINDLPNFYDRGIKADFKSISAIGVPGQGFYSTSLTIAPWGKDDNSGDKNHQLNFNNGGIFYRNAYPLDSQWGTWRKFIIEDEKGNVGIGTKSPLQKLEVGGNGLFNGSIISSISGVIGGELSLVNPSKTSNGIAKIWNIYNMTGDYGNSLQFWAYDNVGCTSGGLCANKFTIMDNGNVGIGTGNPQSKLTVAGGIHAQEIKVTVNAGADFVFEDNYSMPSLDSVATYIKENKHLPEIASAEEMKKEGINLSEMNIKLLQKIEELTLYMIEMKKEIEKQKTIIELQDQKTEKLKNDLATVRNTVSSVKK